MRVHLLALAFPISLAAQGMTHAPGMSPDHGTPAKPGAAAAAAPMAATQTGQAAFADVTTCEEASYAACSAHACPPLPR